MSVKCLNRDPLPISSPFKIWNVELSLICCECSGYFLQQSNKSHFKSYLSRRTNWANLTKGHLYFYPPSTHPPKKNMVIILKIVKQKLDDTLIFIFQFFGTKGRLWCLFHIDMSYYVIQASSYINFLFDIVFFSNVLTIWFEYNYLE